MKCLTVLSRLVPFTLLVGLLVLGTSDSVSAQPAATGTTPMPMPRATSGDLIREADLKIRLEDEDGELVAVPGFTLDVFRELLALQSRIADQQADVPRAVFIGSIEAIGTVAPTQDFVQFEIVYRIRLTRRSAADGEAWTSVTLGLDEAFVDIAASQHEESGEFFIGKEGSSYVCWLYTRPGTSHTLRVQAKVPFRRVGELSSVGLKLPNMPTTARLSISGEPVEVPTPNARNNVSVLAQDDGTLISLDNGGGGFETSWKRRGSSSPGALESTAAVTMHIHGNYVASEAQLKVRSRGEPIDSFIVRLPPDMELISRNEPGFLISALPASDGNNKQQAVLVKRLDGPTSGLIEVRLEAAIPPVSTDKPQRTIQLSGFAIENAIREWGSIDVTLEGNWSTTWLAGQFVQRVALPEDPTRQPPVAARFLYDRQPYSLRLELRPKQARMSVDSTYLLNVTKGRVDLDARLRYSTTGTKIESLNFQVPGWTIKSVLPEELLARPYSVSPSGELTIPLAAGATEFELQFQAERALAEADSDVAIPLPRSTGQAVLSAATVVVLSAPDVELIPDLVATKWLLQETRPPTLKLPESPSPPLVYREELSTESDEPSVFVARKRLRAREVGVTITSQAQLENEQWKINQTWAITVAYDPLQELQLAVPTRVVDAGTLQVALGGEALPVRTLTPATEAPGIASQVAGTTLLAVDLPAPILGNLDISVSYALAMKDLTGAEALRIPLVQPVEAAATKLVAHSLNISTDETVVVTLADDTWMKQPNGSSTTPDHADLRLRAERVLPEAKVRISTVEHRSTESITISQAWLQTWLTTSDRRDRSCFQIISAQPILRVQLPPTAQSAGLRILLDGKSPENWEENLDQSLTITLGETYVGRPATLEIWFWSDPLTGSRSEIALPTVLDAERIERVYWQLVLPRRQHLAWTPRTLTSELAWYADDWYWGRRGRLEQPALEELLGASTQDAVSLETNRYLFSSTGSVAQFEMVTVSRLSLMLFWSGATFALLLPFIYLPTLRQPVILFALGLLLVALAGAFPDQALLCGQAAAIGLLLSVVAMLLQRLVGRRVTVTTIRRGSVLLAPDSQPSSTPLRGIEGSSRVTTATAPAHLQVARIEGDS